MTDRARIQAMLHQAAAVCEVDDVDVDYVSYYTRGSQPVPHRDVADSTRGPVSSLQLPNRPASVATQVQSTVPGPRERARFASLGRGASSTPPRPHAQPAPLPMSGDAQRRGDSPARTQLTAPIAHAVPISSTPAAAAAAAAGSDPSTASALEAQLHALTGQLEMWRSHATTATEALEVAFQENERLAARIRELEAQIPSAAGVLHPSGIEQASWHGRVHGTPAVATIASGWLRVGSNEHYYADCEMAGLKTSVAGSAVTINANNGAVVEFVFESAAYAAGFVAMAATAAAAPLDASAARASGGQTSVSHEDDHERKRVPNAVAQQQQHWSDAELLAAVDDVVGAPHLAAPLLASASQPRRPTGLGTSRATTPAASSTVRKRPASVSRNSAPQSSVPRRASDAPSPRPSTVGRAPSWAATPRPTYAALHAAAAAASPFASTARRPSPAPHSTRADAAEILRAGMPALPSRVEALRRPTQS